MSDRNDLLKRMHDLALAEKPDGAEHDKVACPICSDTASTDRPDQATGGENVDTFTKEQHEQALAEALKPLQDEIAALKAAQATDEVKAAVDAAKAESAEEIARLTAELDAAQIEKNEAVAAAEVAKTEFEAFKTELAELEAAETAAAEREGRKAERIEKVKEVAKFDDDQIAAKADRWADMDDADFASLVEDYKLVAEKAAAATGSTETGGESAMSGTSVESETAGLQGGSALDFIGKARESGFVPGAKF